jgi:hypothetical protein
MARTIQSPGVEIREVDFTTRAATTEGTNVFIAGFANQGPIDEVLSPSTLSEFEQIYGSPTNSAEQYFYHTARAVFNSPAKVITTRLPYGELKGDGFSSWKYSALAYPVRAIKLFKLELAEGQVVETFTNLNGINISSIQYLNNPYFAIDVTENNRAIFYALTGTGPTLGLGTMQVSYPLNIEYKPFGEETNVTIMLANSGDATSLETNDITYFFGSPTHIELTEGEYENILSNNINWTQTPSLTSKNDTITFNNIGHTGLIIVNKSQTTINNNYEGYYVGLIDNNNNNPATDFNGVRRVLGIQSQAHSVSGGSQNYENFVEIPQQRLNFSLSASKFGDGNSISEILENLSEFDIGNREFNDTISLGLFKLRKSVYSPDVNTLDFTPTETYVGSLDYHRQLADQQGGPAKTFYIKELVENNSKNISMLINPFITNRYSTSWIDNKGNVRKKARFLSEQLKTPIHASGFNDTPDTYVNRVGAPEHVVAKLFNDLGTTDNLYSIGVYQNNLQTQKDIGNLPSKLMRAFELVDSPDIYPMNLALEAGLGTVYVNALAQSDEAEKAKSYVDSVPLQHIKSLYSTNADLIDDKAMIIRNNYSSVANVFIDAASKQRKDFMVILDPLRNIFVQGSNSKVINTKKILSSNAGETSNPTADGYVTTNFGQHIYWPLRHLYSTINSSYACTYSTWAQVNDLVSNRQAWVPFSGFAAANMASTDSNFQPWFAPAGFTRGVLTGINDIGVYPKQKQRDQLYKIGVNPVAFFPGEGHVIFGQKTLLKKPSAFDRINVRRLFLALEIAVRDTIKYFVFEPNTLFTRTQVVNTLSPLFETAKNSEGIYDYLIVCDERNNTPDVIDNNELKVDIYIKPVRTAEFILVSFIATRTSQNFSELVGS